ncbi:Multiple myeloma tumor-associated [Hyphodiscus hymeniophilus]|uniref:Multiple myeloma tumor-associated n=1 Tax=Hyphodiscus hymeniophilus TaxID=353542 RepID=A0A9P6VII8_9HELO|nr:Multiple myeloma tumor-associated [Hyphodiscus hymeniophilus]
MDLLSSIRKSGSRGGVNFSWDEVSTSQHRENYLGHSLMAPVGRWQKGRDLNWYAKGDDQAGVEGETAAEKKVRERKEEIRRIKEAEEDALARALGLPVAERNQTGANAVSVGEMNRVMKEVEDGNEAPGEIGRGKGFGDFVGKVEEGDQAVKGEGVEWDERRTLVKGGIDREVASENGKDPGRGVEEDIHIGAHMMRGERGVGVHIGGITGIEVEVEADTDQGGRTENPDGTIKQEGMRIGDHDKVICLISERPAVLEIMIEI